MARRRRTQAPEPGNVVRPYNSQISKQNLDKFGFSTTITSKSVEQITKDWHDTANLFLNRPSRQEYVAGKAQVANVGAYTFSYLFTEPTRFMGAQIHPNAGKSTDICGLFRGDSPYGKAIGDMLAADGYKTLESFAAAMPESWEDISTSMTLYNFPTQKFHGKASGCIFLALNPEYRVGETQRDPELGGAREELAKERVSKIITQIHRNCGPAIPCWSRDKQAARKVDTNPMVQLISRLYPEKLVSQVRSLPHIEDLEEKMDALEPYENLVNRPYTQTTLDGLFHLLGAVYERRNMTRVLHFIKTPMLDRRIVAIILRACPNVTMIGIYDCPLTHFGDVLSLLDLVHEVNQHRVCIGKPKVESVDFFPRFNSGIPYAHGCASAFGITWSEPMAEVAQRGIFRILLEAFLKAKAMKINLLFDEGKAFRKYLSQLPLLPLAVESFLDGLHRYCALKESKSSNVAGMKEAMYDMLKSVRLGIEDLSKDSSHWYSQVMGANLVFCSSCGYDMLEEFYTCHSRHSRPHTRVCAGCLLREQMDMEDHQQKQNQRKALDCLFENWDPKKFNKDAPLHRWGNDIFRLRTTDDVRPAPPSMQVLPNGDFYQRPFMDPLVRDNKLYGDSLQNLPSLRELFSPESEGRRSRAMYEAMVIDADRVTARFLTDIYSTRQGNLASFHSSRADGGRPNTDDEAQIRVPVTPKTRMSFSWEFARAFHQYTTLTGQQAMPDEFW